MPASTCSCSRLPAALLLGAAALCLSGCGGGNDGPNRFDISGKATFNGQPIAVGKIIFEPDAAKGNNGPQGFADIVNGEFDTKKTGKGTVGGPHTIRIQGYDGQALEGRPQGKHLFLEWPTSTDLPKETTTKDFDVPKKAADDLPKGPITPA